MKKLVFVISHKPDIRYQKRLELLKRNYDVSIVYWNKDSNRIDFTFPDVDSYEIQVVANKTNPLKRLPQTCIFIKKAYKKICQLKPDILYVGNIDMLSIAAKYKNVNRDTRIVYEIADLHSLIIDKQKNLIKKAVSYKLIHEERKLLKLIDLLVLTSMKFYDIYFKDYISKEKIVFMPNMPDEDSFVGFKRKEHDGFNVAFVGSIRYKNQLKLLIDAAEDTSVNVIFAGGDANGPDFEEECKKYSFVTYKGEFNYKSDIKDIYSDVDCIYSVYDADMINVRVALPNKLYESIATGIPIIVAKNTYLSELVKDMDVGFAVDHKNKDELVTLINSIKDKGQLYKQKCDNCVNYQKTQNLAVYNETLKKRIGNL